MSRDGSARTFPDPTTPRPKPAPPPPNASVDVTAAIEAIDVMESEVEFITDHLDGFHAGGSGEDTCREDLTRALHGLLAVRTRLARLAPTAAAEPDAR